MTVTPQASESTFPAQVTVRNRRSLLNGSRSLGLLLLAPAVIIVIMFFLIPVVLTAVFSLPT